VRASIGVHAALFSVALLFGANYVVAKSALREISPLGLVLVRTAGAAALLGAAARVRRREGVARPSRGDLAQLFGFSLLGVSINQIFFLEGLARSTATNASVILVTIPVLTLGFAIALRRERASPSGVLGVVVGLAGALVLVVPRGPIDVSSRASVGNALLLVNGSSYALYLVLTRPILSRIEPLVAVAWVFAFAAITVLPFGLPGALAAVRAGVSWPGIAAIAYVVVGGTMLPYLLNNWALVRAKSSLVAAYIFVQPVVAGALGRVFQHDELAPHTAIAAALIGSGVFLAGRRRE
jgi:drug/metabolite transporter (DMT)-like permease